MPALAEHHVRVALLEDVLGGHQQLLERRGEAALEQRRAAGAADLREQRVVLHVARADLDHVGDLQHVVEVAHVHQLGDDRQAGLGLRLGEQPQALLPETLEGVGGGARLVGAAAQQRRAARPAPRAPSRSSLLARFDGARPRDQREVLAADLAPVDVEHGALAVAELRRGELVGLEDRHDAVHTGLALQPEARDVASCSTSPIAPITVTRAPRLR